MLLVATVVPEGHVRVTAVTLHKASLPGRVTSCQYPLASRVGDKSVARPLKMREVLEVTTLDGEGQAW